MNKTEAIRLIERDTKYRLICEDTYGATFQTNGNVPEHFSDKELFSFAAFCEAVDLKNKVPPSSPAKQVGERLYRK